MEDISEKLFKDLQDDAMKVLDMVCKQEWKQPKYWKSSVYIVATNKGGVKKHSESY